MRSLLFVPGDDPRKIGKAAASGADAIILDLEDSVAPERKSAARRTVLAALEDLRAAAERPVLYVRINSLSSGLADADLDVVMTGRPDGIVLPKAGGGGDVALLDSRIAVREALHDRQDGGTAILAIATETAASIFGLGGYARASARLRGIAWGGEDLAADIGAIATKAEGGWPEPFRLARNLLLFAAAAAEVAAIDGVYTDFRDLDGLRRESEAAARDGFQAKLAIHPAQVAIINAAFIPTEAEIEHARRVVEAFSASSAGAVALDGAMLDRPHLAQARRLLARRGASTGSA